MSSSEDSPKQGKGFFTVALSLIDDMVKQGAGADELAAYLVLARGAGKKTYTSWAANAVANYTGLTYYRANESISWLVEHSFISKPIFSTDDKSKKTKLKWQFKQAADDIEVVLANVLVDGMGAGANNPPLARIHSQITMGKHGLGAARLDTLMVLLHLYKHQLLADYGGINPQAGIYKHWQTAENSYGDKVADLAGTVDAALYEIKGGADSVYEQFAKESLFYVPDADERHQRFWDAFNNLKQLGWLYETTQIWSADPSKHKRAEPLYTLYVHDRHARDSDPYLANSINQVAIKQVNPDYGFFNQDGEFDPEADLFGGQFRYVANKKTGGFPIGIYRLKFRPHTKDTGKGMAAESQRVKGWEQALHAL